MSREEATEAMNKALIELWDSETGVDIYDLDSDNIDLKLGISEAPDDSYPYVLSVEAQTGADIYGIDLEDLFGFTEWNSVLYFMTQLKPTPEIKAWVYSVMMDMNPHIPLESYKQAVAHELNEIAKMEDTNA